MPAYFKMPLEHDDKEGLQYCEQVDWREQKCTA